MVSPSTGDTLPYIVVEVPKGVAPEKYQPDGDGTGAPLLPPRPSAAPVATDVNAHKPQTEALKVVAAPTTQQIAEAAVIKPEASDEKESHFAKRFMGNMLVARLGRAGLQSVSSTVKLPLYLSPWGDNNPFMLPNLRKRDLALAGVMHFGADALIGSSLTAVETVVAHGASWTAEQSVDQGYDKLWAGPRPHEVKRTAGLTSVEVRIKHKLMGEAADLRFFESKEAASVLSCAKGWFCPYLYCSSRVSQLSRMKDFTVAEVMGPGLKGMLSFTRSGFLHAN